MHTYIAYVRVSTQQQAHGASLDEQRRAISRYATDRNLSITAWYEEVQTAAKRGRFVFADVMRELQRGGAHGLILHKVDRGARNLRDWADLGELIDRGIDVRFAADGIDMETRGGRLSADIQAVIAADYIRNLREEVRKGIYGRLRQGLYPLPAPLGYRNRGGGLIKLPDPYTAPLVIFAFQLYATGQHTLDSLAVELARRGLARSQSAWASLLRQPFYAGLMRVRGSLYPGTHQPLISHELFSQVQSLLRRRSSGKRTRHHFRFQQLLECCGCGTIARRGTPERHRILPLPPVPWSVSS